MQCCFNQIITHHGDNDYHIDHIAKEKLEWNGNLPDVIDVVDDAEHLLDPNKEPICSIDIHRVNGRLNSVLGPDQLTSTNDAEFPHPDNKTDASIVFLLPVLILIRILYRCCHQNK